MKFLEKSALKRDGAKRCHLANCFLVSICSWYNWSQNQDELSDIEKRNQQILQNYIEQF